MSDQNNDFLYGKNPIQNVVSVEMKDGGATIYTEDKDGVQSQQMEAAFWLIYDQPYRDTCLVLDGRLHYRYACVFQTKRALDAEVQFARRLGWDYWICYNPSEMFMMRSGVGYFGDMDIGDASVLSFDIETTSLDHRNGKVLLISNTFRRGGAVTRKLFSHDQWNNNRMMIDAWCAWVREMDPSVLVGHNLYGFDMPYLLGSAGKPGLALGRDGSKARFGTRPRKFRKDGSQTYDYNPVRIFGREIVDTFFLSIKYDVARNYPSYGLKPIIDFEGLERKDRQHYDAGQIRKNYHDADEWVKIKEYAEHDADDALALYDLMAPQYFHYAKYIPKSFQEIINTATGSQVNSFMLRSYLQDQHSVPRASERVDYEGAISYGNPGIYKNVSKVDVAALYPSIIRAFKIEDKNKDPRGHFLKMVDIFTEERLRNKTLAKSKGERQYRDLEQSQKIIINSAYGFLGATGLNFNYPAGAAAITKRGREICQQGITWAEERGYIIVNVDTDSFSYTTGNALNKEGFTEQIIALNEVSPDGIVWEADGQYKRVIVVRAKNYVLFDGKKTVIKGSGLKATMKEPALRRFLAQSIELLLKDRKDQLYDLYSSYTRDICNIGAADIPDWSSKKTITKAVLNPDRTTEQRILDAVMSRIRTGEVVEGDKVHMFFKTPTELCMAEDFTGEINRPTLLKKLYNTLSILDTVIDAGLFPNYALKRNDSRIRELDVLTDKKGSL